MEYQMSKTYKVLVPDNAQQTIEFSDVIEVEGPIFTEEEAIELLEAAEDCRGYHYRSHNYDEGNDITYIQVTFSWWSSEDFNDAPSEVTI